jgi:hypothetical protein
MVGWRPSKTDGNFYQQNSFFAEKQFQDVSNQEFSINEIHSSVSDPCGMKSVLLSKRFKQFTAFLLQFKTNSLIRKYFVDIYILLTAYTFFFR